MQVVTADLIRDKKVLLRFDIDVPLVRGEGGRWEVGEDFRLKAGLPTLKLCLEGAQQVVIMGHVGRPAFAEATAGKPDSFFVPSLSVEPIYDWLAEQDSLRSHLSGGNLKLLENLRFEKGEEDCDLEYAKELASYGDFFVNEAFAAHHPAASTTVLPTLLPHAAGLRFEEEVEKLTAVRENPKRPLVVIIGGVKIEDKGSAIEAMAKIADYVLVGGKLVTELRQKYHDRDTNVRVADLIESGMDITEETIKQWETIIKEAQMIVWNGPMGKIEEEEYSKGTKEIARAIISSSAESIIGGGDTIGLLGNLRMLDQFNFLSTGGGAMLKFLGSGTLPSIEALNG